MSLAYDHANWRQPLAARLDAELRHAHPRTVLEAAVETLGERLAPIGVIVGEAHRSRSTKAGSRPSAARW